MPTKGRPQLGTRVSHELYDEMMQCIVSQNEFKEGEPYTIATWIETAIAERVAKWKRGKGIKGAGAARYPTRAEEDRTPMKPSNQ